MGLGRIKTSDLRPQGLRRRFAGDPQNVPSAWLRIRRSDTVGCGCMELETEILRLAEDPRGVVFEPITAADLSRQQNAHVVFTQPGGVRGNHYHEHGTEIMAVMGSALVRIRDSAGVRDIQVAERQVIRFTLPPGVAHAILNTGAQTGVIVSFNSLAHDPELPDVVREVLIPPH